MGHRFRLLSICTVAAILASGSVGQAAARKAPATNRSWTADTAPLLQGLSSASGGQFDYLGTMTTTVSGGSAGTVTRSYNAYVVLEPPKSAGGITETNPFSLTSAPTGSQSDPAEISLMSAAIYNLSMYNPVLFQYWTYTLNGSSFSGTLTNSHTSEGIAANLLNASVNLAGISTVCTGAMYDARFGQSYQATMNGSLVGNQITIHVSGYAPECGVEVDAFTTTIQANLVSPLVASVSPSTGSTNGGTSVTIGGAGFTGATAVHFGGSNAQSFAVNADGTITAVTPPHSAGSVDVTVTNQYGSSPTSSNDMFTYGSSGGGSTVTLNAGAGWNMVGGSPLTLWPDSTVNWAYSASSGSWYQPNGSEAAGTGAWEYVSTGGGRTVNVQSCSAPVSIPVVAHRWNLVGNLCGTTVSLPASARALWWDPNANAYVATSTINPGAGVWVESDTSPLTLSP